MTYKTHLTIYFGSLFNLKWNVLAINPRSNDNLTPGPTPVSWREIDNPRDRTLQHHPLNVTQILHIAVNPADGGYFLWAFSKYIMKTAYNSFPVCVASSRRENVNYITFMKRIFLIHPEVLYFSIKTLILLPVNYTIALKSYGATSSKQCALPICFLFKQFFSCSQLHRTSINTESFYLALKKRKRNKRDHSLIKHYST